MRLLGLLLRRVVSPIHRRPALHERARRRWSLLPVALRWLLVHLRRASLRVCLLRRRCAVPLLLHGRRIRWLLLRRWGRIVHWGTPRTRTVLLLRGLAIRRTIRASVVARTALNLLGCRWRCAILLHRGLLGLLGRRTRVHRRHVVRDHTACRVELDADARARRALLMRWLLGYRDGALARSRTGVCVPMASGRAVRWWACVAVAVPGARRRALQCGTTAARERLEGLRARAAALCAYAGMTTGRTHGAV